MKHALILLVVVGGLFAADEAPPVRPEEVACAGCIESFDKDGFQALCTDGACERFDITWVVVRSPKNFEGVRHMLLSRTSTGKSAFGEIGSTVSFSAYRSTLEAEQHPERGRIDMKKLLSELESKKPEEKKTEPNKRPEGTEGKCPPSNHSQLPSVPHP